MSDMAQTIRVHDWLVQTQQQLEEAGISTARLDSLVLLEDETGLDRSWLLAYPDHKLQGSEIKNLNKKIVQRINHTPLAYIRGHAEFYGRNFEVTPHTLVPRPETESMIELLKSLELPPQTRIVDVGTGSGCIAITASLELKDTLVSACDIDANCIEIAKRNARTLNASVTFFESNLLTNVGQQDIILANLPYVPNNFHINTAATHEPKHALFGGEDGLNPYRELFAQLNDYGWRPRYLLLESLPFQHEQLANIASAADFRLLETQGLIQLFE